MKNKSLSLTPAQFKNLMILVYLGEFMINGIRGGKGYPKTIKRYEKVLKFIIQNAKNFGMGNCVKKYKDDDAPYPTREFEEKFIDQRIYDYDEESFWRELSSHFADRDFYRQYGDQKLSGEERLGIIWEIEDYYEEEISENGLENFEVVNNDELDMLVSTKAGQVGNRYRYFAVFTTPNSKPLTENDSKVIKSALEKIAKKFDSQIEEIHVSDTFYVQITILIPEDVAPQSVYDALLDIVASKQHLLNYHVLTGNVKKFSDKDIDEYRQLLIKGRKTND